MSDKNPAENIIDRTTVQKMKDFWYTIFQNYFVLWILCSMSILLILAMVGIHRPFWGDERHYFETIKLFEQSEYPKILFDYPEVTPPLFYIVFAMLGKFVGYTLFSFRAISLVIAFIASVLMFLLTEKCLGEPRKTFFLCLILMLNPYFLGLSLFVFNDMAALLFLLGSAICFINNKYLFSAVFLGLGLLCRQYIIFAVCAMWLTQFLESLFSHNWKATQKFSLYVILAILPLAILMIFWGGMAPPSGVQKWIGPESRHWSPQSFIMYIAFSGLYLLPVLYLSKINRFKLNWIFFASLGLGLFSFLFPLEASIVSQAQIQGNTVGLAHKAIVFLVGHGPVESVIFYGITSIGFWILLSFLQNDIQRIKMKYVKKENMFSISIYFFLCIMPFSYQRWEKYIVLLLPLAATGWMLMAREGNADNTQGKIFQTLII